MPQDSNPNKHCATANSLLGKNKPQSFFDKAKNAVGSSLGQGAFNFVKEKLPRIAVDNNVNGGVRRLVDAVNRGNLSFAGKTINTASQAVLGAAGINSNVVPPDPNQKTMYDNGIAAAETIGEALIVGVIDEADLPGPINDLSVLANLQQQQAQEPYDITDPQCGTTPYARDLLSNYTPKFDFMFMVQIILQPDYEDLMIQEHEQLAKDEQRKLQFLCYQFTRPDISIEYEDVNMYNFKTQVAKRTNYAPVQMKFYDDNANSSMVFLEKYIKAISPIARKPIAQQDLYETRGLDFEPYPTTSTQGGTALGELKNSSSSMEGLVNENRSIIRRVEVYHIFNFGTKVNKYSFMNPKVMNFSMMDFDMTDGSQASSIDMQLNYDSMFIETDYPINTPIIQELSKLGQRQMLKYSND